MKRIILLVALGAIGLSAKSQSQVMEDLSGNVGIRGWPQDNFYVNGNSFLNGKLGLGGYNNLLSDILFINGNSFLNGNLGIGATNNYTEKLFVEGNSFLNGNLGIGAYSTPAERLFVNGNSFFSANLGLGAINNFPEILFVEGNSFLNGKLGLGGTNKYSEILFVDGGSFLNGNVGIGTPASTYKLQVEGTTFLNGNVRVGVFPYMCSNTKLCVEGHTFFNGRVGIGMDIADYPEQELLVNGHTIMYGNLGIGISDANALNIPDRLVDIEGFNNVKLLVRNGHINGARTGIFSQYPAGIGRVGTESDHDLRLVAGFNDIMTLQPEGNVGIGTTAPKQKLHVANGSILLEKLSDNLFFANDDPDCLMWGIEYCNGTYGAGTGLNFWQPWSPNCSNHMNYALFLHDEGNVGINTPNPRAKLHVDGTGLFEDNVGIGRLPSSVYKLDVNGSLNATSIYINGYGPLSTSDERLKTGIRPISDEKENLYLLQGKFYHKTLRPISIEDSSEQNQIFPEYGYLAQELKEFFPELVTVNAEGYYAVNYMGLIPIIVEALKDQRQTIENLQQNVKGENLIDNELQHEVKFLRDTVMCKMQQEIEFLKEALNACCSKGEQKSMKNNENDESTNIQEFNLDAKGDNMTVYQNVPNPFNVTTTIQCYIPQTIQHAELCIYNMQGKQLKCLTVSGRGTTTVQIQAGQLAAGVYTYLLIGDGQTSDAKQMILTK